MCNLYIKVAQDDERAQERWSDQHYQCCQSNLPPSTIWGGSQLPLVCNFQTTGLLNSSALKPLDRTGLVPGLINQKWNIFYIKMRTEAVYSLCEDILTQSGKLYLQSGQTHMDTRTKGRMETTGYYTYR